MNIIVQRVFAHNLSRYLFVSLFASFVPVQCLDNNSIEFHITFRRRVHLNLSNSLHTSLCLCQPLSAVIQTTIVFMRVGERYHYSGGMMKNNWASHYYYYYCRPLSVVW